MVVPTAHVTAAPAISPTQTLAPPPAESTAVIRTCIEGDFEGWTGDTVFELCNGQVWVQVGYAYTYRYAYRPNVTIISTGSLWIMSVEGVRDTVAVAQVEFIRSRIEGTFEGWDGSTVFPLINGQVWQQVGSGYRYAYRYRPTVLIYVGSSGGYRMKVDGVDETVRVSRLR